MKFHRFAFIFIMPGFDSKKHMAEMSENGFTFKTVGVDMANKAEVVEVAKSLAAEGYQMIELCGGFGPDWVTKVKEAIGSDVAVGGVFYGPEYRKTLVDLMS